MSIRPTTKLTFFAKAGKNAATQVTHSLGQEEDSMAYRRALPQEHVHTSTTSHTHTIVLMMFLFILGTAMSLGGCGWTWTWVTPHTNQILDTDDTAADDVRTSTPHPDWVEYKPDEIGFMSVAGLTLEQVKRVSDARGYHERCLDLMLADQNNLDNFNEFYTRATQHFGDVPEQLSGDVFEAGDSYQRLLLRAERYDEFLARNKYDRASLELYVGEFLFQHPDMVPFVRNPVPRSGWPADFNFCFGDPSPAH